MKNYLKLLVISAVSFAYAEPSPVYLNFIKAQNISNMSIDIDSSCKGSGISLAPENIKTGFYVKTPSKYYLKVKANLNESKKCLNQLSSKFIYRDSGLINYFPDLPADKYYANVVSYGEVYSNIPNWTFADNNNYKPNSLFFSVTGTISLQVGDVNSGYTTSTIPITLAFGKFKSNWQGWPTSTINTWFIVGGENSEFKVENGTGNILPNRMGHSELYWYTGISLFDEAHDRYFCLSSNLKDSETIKIYTGKCPERRDYTCNQSLSCYVPWW